MHPVCPIDLISYSLHSAHSELGPGVRPVPYFRILALILLVPRIWSIA